MRSVSRGGDSKGGRKVKESVVIDKRRERWEKHESAEAGEADLI